MQRAAAREENIKKEEEVKPLLQLIESGKFSFFFQLRYDFTKGAVLFCFLNLFHVQL
jgi:hypothetical protein